MHVDQQETDSIICSDPTAKRFGSSLLGEHCPISVFIIFWPVRTANIDIWLRSTVGEYFAIGIVTVFSVFALLPLHAVSCVSLTYSSCETTAGAKY